MFKTSKKTLAVALVLVLALSLFTITAAASGGLVAAPTASTVLVNAVNVAFDAYNIADNNYFKLRDIAYTLNGTVKQFEVEWDWASNAIRLTSGMPYTSVGGEMQGKGLGNKTPIPTNSRVFLDGIELQLTAYNIEDNNYFKLRDIGEAIDIGVTWDGPNNRIIVDTAQWYDPNSVPNYAHMYSNSMMGSAKYLEGRSLFITIFCTFENTVWSADDISAVADRLRVAEAYFENEAAKAGKSLDLVSDFVRNPDLRYDLDYVGEFFQYPADGVFTEAVNKSTNDANAYMDDFIEDNIPYLALADKYETDSIAFIFVVKEWYVNSYALSYSPEGSQNRYNEKVVIVYGSERPPYTYAHELLHIFGAVDLYFDSAYYGVSKDLVEYTERTYPTDIMYDGNYGDNERIIQMISPITAYCIGWLSDIPELTQFPQLRREFPAVYKDQSRVA